MPESLGDWAGQKFLRIRFDDLDPAALDDRLGTVIDDAVTTGDSSGKKRDGMTLLQRGVKAAMPRGVTVDLIKPDSSIYEAKLDSSFFRVRLDRATEMQRIYLGAMAELGPEPQKAADVASLMRRTSPQVAPTRAELINMGLLYTPEHGYAAFTVPHFDQFSAEQCRTLSSRKPAVGTDRTETWANC